MRKRIGSINHYGDRYVTRRVALTMYIMINERIEWVVVCRVNEVIHNSDIRGTYWKWSKEMSKEV